MFNVINRIHSNSILERYKFQMKNWKGDLFEKAWGYRNVVKKIRRLANHMHFNVCIYFCSYNI